MESPESAFGRLGWWWDWPVRLHWDSWGRFAKLRLCRCEIPTLRKASITTPDLRRYWMGVFGNECGSRSDGSRYTRRNATIGAVPGSPFCNEFDQALSRGAFRPRSPTPSSCL